MHYKKDGNQIEIYLETRKRRIKAATLTYIKKTKRFHFVYDIDFLRSKSSFPVGPEFPLNKKEFTSKPNRLFPTFLDRIPPKENPAYPEYCASQGISVDEKNLIILLGTIGRRGPSSFIYEPIFKPADDIVAELKHFRAELELSQWDVACLFDIPLITLKNIELGKSHDKNSLELIRIYLQFPTVTLDKISRTGKYVHRNTRTKVYLYFKTASDTPTK